MQMKKKLLVPLAVLAIGPAVLVTVQNSEPTFVNAAKTTKTTTAAKTSSTKTAVKAFATITHEYKLTDQQNVLYRFSPAKNGYHAVYDKPGTTKDAHVLKSVDDVRAAAHEYTYDNYLYATKSATTSRGSTYLYVKSFDGKTNGWIYASGVRQIAASFKTTNKYSDYAYINNAATGSLYAQPLGTTKYKTAAISNLYNYANDKFKILETQQAYRTGEKSVLVQDTNNSDVKGWISEDNLKASLVKNQLGFDDTNMVKVKFVDTNTGQTVTTANLPTGVDGNGADVSNAVQQTSKLGSNAWGNAQLANYGYQYDSTLSTNQTALSSVKNGDTITLAATPVYKHDTVTSSLSFSALNTDTTTATTAPLTLQKDGTIGSDTLVFPANFNNSIVNALTGRPSDYINMDKVITAINASENNGQLTNISGYRNYTTDSLGNEVYAGDSATSNSVYHYVYRLNESKTRQANAYTKYGQALSLVYDKVKVANATPITTTTTTNNGLVILGN